MSLLSRLFGRKPDVPSSATPVGFGSPRPVQPDPNRVDIVTRIDVAAHSDLLSGWRFVATMQLRTPLRVLSRHGEVHKGLSSEPPIIAREQWEGIWVATTRSYRELGIDMEEPALTIIASDVGTIPADGGDYLPFLIAVRTAAEGDGSIAERREAVAAVLRDPTHRKFVRAHGGQGEILDHLFPPFAAAIPRVSGKVAQAVASAGYRTPAKISAASDKELRVVEGVGPATIKALREAAAAATDQSARYVDRVTR